MSKQGKVCISRLIISKLVADVSYMKAHPVHGEPLTTAAELEQAQQEMREEMPTNTRLIAEAPAMLELMKEFVDRVERGEVRSRKTYAAFKEVIAKIEGRQSDD